MTEIDKPLTDVSAESASTLGQLERKFIDDVQSWGSTEGEVGTEALLTLALTTAIFLERRERFNQGDRMTETLNVPERKFVRRVVLWLDEEFEDNDTALQKLALLVTEFSDERDHLTKEDA